MDPSLIQGVVSMLSGGAGGGAGGGSGFNLGSLLQGKDDQPRKPSCIDSMQLDSILGRQDCNSDILRFHRLAKLVRNSCWHDAFYKVRALNVISRQHCYNSGRPTSVFAFLHRSFVFTWRGRKVSLDVSSADISGHMRKVSPKIAPFCRKVAFLRKLI